MKTTSLLSAVTLAALVFVIGSQGCRKKPKEAEPDTEHSYVQDHNLIETYNQDIGNIGSEAKENNSLSNYKTNGNLQTGELSVAPCATVTIDSVAKTYTVDFGPTLCLCLDGRYRSGKLIYNYSASTNGATRPRHPGFSVTCTSQNYLVSNSPNVSDAYTVNIIQRTHTNITPPGFNPAVTNIKWSVSTNIQVSKPASVGGGTASWNGNRIVELTNTSDPTVYDPSGNVPIAWSKVKLRINGSGSGTTANNISYTESLSNLEFDATCTPNPAKPKRHPFKSGTITFTPSGKPARVIDFGTGACDLQATVCVPQYNYCAQITLP